MFSFNDLPKTSTEFVKKMREAVSTSINFLPNEETRKATKQVVDFQYNMLEVWADQFDRTMSFVTAGMPKAPAKAKA